MCLLGASLGLSKNTIPNLKDSESTGFKRGRCCMKITKVGLVGLFLFAIMLLSAQVALPQSSRIVTETIMVPASDPGIQLHVRNKHPEGISNFGLTGSCSLSTASHTALNRLSTYHSTAYLGWIMLPNVVGMSISWTYGVMGAQRVLQR